MIHILRVDEVATAIASHKDVSSVPENNIALMHKMGLEKIRRINKNL